MLKKRIIACVIIRDGIVVQSFGFSKYLPVGSLKVTLEFLDKWGVDEIVLLDISANKSSSMYVLDHLKESITNCFVPLTYGGGLAHSKDIEKAFRNGADKVSFNQAFFSNTKIIEKTSVEYGVQSVVISIDVKKDNGNYHLYDYLAKETTKITVQSALDKAQGIGAGELFIKSVDRDGSYEGFDYEIVESLSEIKIPLILAGGARFAAHYEKGLSMNRISGLAAGNLFHFTEHSVTKLKALLSNYPIRIDSDFNYQSHSFIQDQRLVKKDDTYLEGLLYKKLEDRDI